MKVALELEFEASFRDMFAVRGRRADATTPHEIKRGAREGGIVFERVGRDAVRRTTDITMRPAPDRIEGNVFHIERELPPQGVLTIELAVIPREDGAGAAPSPDRFDDAIDALNARYRRFLRSCARYTTSSETLDEGLITRSALDLRALMEFHDSGPFPTAGIPWYAVPFGRDGLICAYQTLGWNPDIARGTLRLLAKYQGQKVDDYSEEEPGKIFHELRRGELARLGEIPHRPYYGSVDATPLFALLVAETVKWTADRELWRELLPAAERALTWCDTYGDADRDGYVEYGPRASDLKSQGWKDSLQSLSAARRHVLEAAGRARRGPGVSLRGEDGPRRSVRSSMATPRARIASAARRASCASASSATSGCPIRVATRRRSTATRSRCAR